MTRQEFDEAYNNGYTHGYAAGRSDSDTLDKIRAEIEQNAYPIVHGVNNHELGMTLYGILQIIDKSSESISHKCDNDYDCEHCDWVECPIESEDKE